MKRWRNVYLERAHERFVYAHHAAGIVKLAAVVGCRKQSHQLALSEEFVSVLNHLMSPANQVQLILSQERKDNLLPEDIADSSLRFSPHLN